MSSMEYHAGTLVLVDIQPTGTFEEQVQEMTARGHTIEEWVAKSDHPKSRDWMYSEELFLHKGKWYLINDHGQDEYGGSIHKDEKGVLHYSVSFYNGGASFEEALEDLLDLEEI